MKTIHHVVDIDADPAVVWAALTDETRLTGWWSTKVDSPPAAVGARTVWTFAGELADDYYGVYNFNWGYYLESLRLLCATGTGKPYPA